MLRINPTRTHWRLLSLFTAVTVALSPSMPLLATPAMEQLFGILKAKGSLTQAEYDLLVAAMKAEEQKPAPVSVPAPAATVTTPTPSANVEQRLVAQDARIKELEAALNGTQSKVQQIAATQDTALEKKIEAQASKVENLENVLMGTKGQVEELSKISDNTSPSTMSKADLDDLLADKWYERMKLRGYMQLRGTAVMGDESEDLNVPNDSIANDLATFGIRRGRLVYSGDATNHLYLYLQADYFGSVNGGTGLQARDYYADISLDPAREWRVRLGQSKVPYGWSNLQSSQNRLAIERPDALNGAVEGERDIGAYLMWAPYEIRNRFKDLVKMGLRGSGDYGLLAIGAYSGNGLNRADNNGQTHYVARVSYPFELDNGQFIELGLQGYTGRFLPGTSSINGVKPIVDDVKGLRDERVGVTAILYPQPFGIEAEWNWGRGPVLSKDMSMITSESLSGGYIQASYRHIFDNQHEIIPFVRWQHFNGGRKFTDNAPRNEVDELAVGLRYIPYPELEMSLMYSHGDRTNTRSAPFDQVKSRYLSIQAQINF